MRPWVIVCLLSASSLSVALDAPSADTLQEEPPAGTLSAGQTVLVDDGSCPAGQIKQVTGGNNAEGQPRRKKCIDQAGATNQEIASERFALGGRKSVFGYYYGVNVDCSPLWQEVKITKSPENGEAHLRDATTIVSYSAPNARTRCNGKSTKALALEYMPAKGYTGKDSIVVERISETGEFRSFKYDITVK
jgi:hypothetical protein